MTIYNLYMNNTEPLTPYDLITVGDSNSGEIIWNGAFFKLPSEYSHKEIKTFYVQTEFNYRHAYVSI